jgi:ubiquinone/menaquinone biosynthesis C-methylase UbiE
MTSTAQRRATDGKTEQARRTYDRGAWLYDLREWLPERLAFRRWRAELWRLVPEGAVLEVGVGTGKNLPHYRDEHDVTAIDFSPKMLNRARCVAERKNIPVRLELMDAQALEFSDSTFDSVVSAFVFCSVPDPVLGLEEARRVLKAGGRAYLLEHVVSQKRPLSWLMRRANGLFRTMSGANIDRDTVANVERAGFRIVEVRDLFSDVVKLIIAEKQDGSASAGDGS